MVNFFSNRLKLNKKRGISTIIGGIIFLILLTAGFSAFFVAMEVQSDTIEAQRTISDSIIDKTLEQFSMVAATDDNNGHKLEIQVINEGPNPLEISDIWIVNKSDTNHPAVKIPVNYSDAFIPSGFNASILANQHLTMLNPASTPADPDLYDIKVISVLGSIQKSELRVGGNNYLLAEMFTIPPDVRKGENTTIALRVTNVGVTTISEVEPADLLLDDVLPPHIEVDTIDPVSISAVDLKPSESTIFSWYVTLDSNANLGIKVKFSNHATGIESVTGFAVTSNTASDKIIIRDPQGGSGDTIVINEDLYSKPEIFAILPGPFGGDSVNNFPIGLWGVNVANPTEFLMNVTKVVFTVTDPEGGGGFDTFSKGCETNGLDNISPWGLPPGPGDWKCTMDNQLRWKNNVPIEIPPKSVYSFLVRVDAPASGGGGSKILESAPIQITVVTSSGQFGKAGYDTSSNKVTDVVAGIFLGNGDNNILPANLNASRTGIDPAAGDQTFNIWLADFSSEGSTVIDDDTKLIINVPRDWIVDQGLLVAENPDWDMRFYGPFSDSSSQIVGILKDDITSSGKKIRFHATPPAKPDTKMYVMHATAHGLTEEGWTVSPLNEMVLQVCGTTSGCPT